jgi:hypothetical protein
MCIHFVFGVVTNEKSNKWRPLEKGYAVKEIHIFVRIHMIFHDGFRVCWGTVPAMCRPIALIWVKMRTLPRMGFSISRKFSLWNMTFHNITAFKKLSRHFPQVFQYMQCYFTLRLAAILLMIYFLSLTSSASYYLYLLRIMTACSTMDLVADL